MSSNGHGPSIDRWDGVERPYTPADVEQLRGSVQVEHTLARLGAERLWHLLQTEPCVPALGALTGGQAVQMVKAGPEVDLPLRLAGRRRREPRRAHLPRPEPLPGQQRARARPAPEQRAPARRPDRARRGQNGTYWLAPIVADAEAGFGGPLNAFELMKAFIEAGAAGVHFEDQLSSEKKCGHLGGKVLVPTAQHIRTLVAARLAADVCGVPTVVVCSHRRSLGEAADERRGRDRRAVHHRRAHGRGLLPRARRPRAGDRPLARLRAVLRPDLVRDLDARSRRGPRVRPGDPRALPGEDVRLQLLAVVQLAQASRRLARSHRSGSRSPSSATATSSSRSPASTR